jgi:hypothetical protein
VVYRALQPAGYCKLLAGVATCVVMDNGALQSSESSSTGQRERFVKK